MQLFQILSGKQNKQRQSESNLAITLVSIVFMHILCNALRVFLGVLVVALVGKCFMTWCFNLTPFLLDIQVSCIKHVDQYIPPLWIMCLESVAHVLVMLNFSSNFLIYCSVSNQFKAALSKLCLFFCKKSSKRKESAKYQNVPTEVIVQQDTEAGVEMAEIHKQKRTSEESDGNPTNTISVDGAVNEASSM